MGVVLYAPALALNAGELTVPSPSVSAVMHYCMHFKLLRRGLLFLPLIISYLVSLVEEIKRNHRNCLLKPQRQCQDQIKEAD